MDITKYPLFDTQSPQIHEVDPRTGQFHTYLPIASIVGNEGRGPFLDLNLFYSPELYDDHLGNWALRFTHLHTNGQSRFSTLYLSTGGVWTTDQNDLYHPAFTLERGSDPRHPTVVHKDGTTERLVPHLHFIKKGSIRPDTETDIVITDYTPEKIISALGLSLTIEWEDTKVNNPVQPYPPRLKSIKDESAILLNVSYSQDLVTFELYPGTQESYKHEFKIDTQNTSLTEAKIVKASSTLATKTFKYNFRDDKKYSALCSIEHPSGLREEISYGTDWKVACHTLSASGILTSKCDYSYEENITTRTNMTEGTPSTTAFHYNSDGVQTSEIHTLGDCTHTIEMTSEHHKEEKELVNTTQHTYKNKETSRTETSTSILDTAGNLIRTTENGITTEWTYYKAFKEEHILMREQGNSQGLVGYLLDDMILPLVTDKKQVSQGFTYGTIDYDATVHHRAYSYGINGKQDYNLPIDIIPLGDPNLFKVFVESEKVYTKRDDKRVDLKWTFYGYTEVPTKDPTLAGPAIKPSIKLTVLDPVTDDYVKLKSWQDGAMTLETTAYYTDINAPDTFGRVKSITQQILDSQGNEVPLSGQTITRQYKLQGRNLTTTSTLTTAENIPVITSQTVSALTAEVIMTVDSLGNETYYEYDYMGRLIGKNDFYQSDELRSRTGFTYYTENGLQCRSTFTPTNEKGKSEEYREEFDALGRIVSTKHYIWGINDWRTLSSTTYDELGREKQTTEYDYRPDGRLLFESQLVTTYNDWGQRSKIQLDGAGATCFDYDPISRESKQWREWGDYSSGVRTRIKDDGKGGQIQENEFFSTVVKIDKETDEKISGETVAQKTISAYDAWGRLSEEVSSTGENSQYDYDHFGRMISMTHAGTVTCYGYPAHAPVMAVASASIQTPEDTEAHTFGKRKFDGLGRLNEVQVGGRQQTYTYNYAGDSSLGASSLTPSDVFQPTQTPSFESSYDRYTGKVTEKATGYPDTTLTEACFTYSLGGVLLECKDAFGHTTKYEYDSLGRPTGSSSDKVITSLSYDDSGALSEETVTDIDSGRCMAIAYTYDEQLRESERRFTVEGFAELAIKRTYQGGWLASTEMLANEELLRREEFSYTPEGRLERYWCSGSEVPLDPQGNSLNEQTFVYDAFGNISECSSIFAQGENTTKYTYDETDYTQLKSISHSAENYPPTTFTYDELGRLHKDSHGKTLRYNQASRLGNLKTQIPDTSYEYIYDPSGRQVACSGADYSEQYYYKDHYQYARKAELQIDGEQYYRTLSLLNDSSACVLQQQTLENSKGEASISNSFEIKDAHGTLVASYNLSDNSPTFFAYTPFGYRPDDRTKPSWLGFNGQPIDRVTGTYPLGNGYRVYDPVNQCFQAPDILSPFDEGGLNSYCYCDNNPINFSDPSGHARIVRKEVMRTTTPLFTPTQVATLNALYGATIGLILTPVTGGTVMTVATVGLATVSGAFGIAAAATQESDPELSERLGWISMGTGLANVAVGVGGAMAKAVSRGLRQGVQKFIPRGGRLPAGQAVTGTVKGVAGEQALISSYEMYVGGPNSRTLLIDAHGFARGRYMLKPLPKTDVQFRSGLGTQAGDKGSSWADLVNNRTPYRYAPGATDIPDYILSEYKAASHLESGMLSTNYQADLIYISKTLNADIVRPIDTMRFSDLINTIHNEGFHYDRIVGNFCRGTIGRNSWGAVKYFRRHLRLF
ncbi:RHS repeat-associated core domain-containing protein [Pseudomonas sp. Z4-7]|uniref:RHS repeat-associated core domain-containing protein n=1 Tax=Pseudomonas sp. Z4-7 TaxID=2817413 RepID=UPI003DA84C9B